MTIKCRTVSIFRSEGFSLQTDCFATIYWLKKNIHFWFHQYILQNSEVWRHRINIMVRGRSDKGPRTIGLTTYFIVYAKNTKRV